MKPYAADKTFTTVVDSENVLAERYGFKVVPNGIFVDEEGKIRLLKQGFWVDEAEHLDAVKKLIAKEVESVNLGDTYYEPPSATTQLEIQLAATKFKLAQEYLRNRNQEAALKELDDAILLDPDNFLIRKQRWHIRYPEKFSPTIDMEWQKQQLPKEREQEARLRQQNCGPEGCVIPGTVE